jgi:hypothetical protein
MADLAELTTFIVSLSEDPAKARRFKETPDLVIDESRVSTETKALLLSEPLTFLREVFLAARPQGIPTVHTTVTTHTNTNTDVRVTTVTNTNQHVAVGVTVIVAPVLPE